VELLRVDRDSVNLERLLAGAPVLDAHNSENVRAQIGVVDHAWIAGGKGHARIRFSERAADIYHDVKAGILRGISIGYSRDEIREIEERHDGLPVREVVRFTPHEISLVSVPADVGASTRTHRKDHSMTTEQRSASNGAPPRSATPEELEAIDAKLRALLAPWDHSQSRIARY
jgi:HK97 family phage prohead protease